VAQAYPLPKWGITMEEGTIATWKVQPGQPVVEGTLLAEVETDKLIVEFESPVAGIVAAHLVEQGVTVGVGTDVIVIARDAADYEAYLSERG